MNSKGIFPSTDADFNNYVILVVAYLNANKVRLGISAGNITALSGLFSVNTPNWSTVYPLFADPATNNKTLTDDKNHLHNQLESLLKSIYDDIPKSALNTTDRTTLRLHERDTTPTHVAKADHAPKASVDHNEHLLITLRLLDPVNPLTRAMPHGEKVMMEQFIGDAGLAEPKIPFASGRIVGKFLKEVDFIADNMGKTIYWRFCYINGTGEMGPWSVALSDVIR